MHKSTEQASEILLVLFLLTPLMFAFINVYNNIHLMGG